MPTFRIPRSHLPATHHSLRAEIIAALEPILFGEYHDSYTIRTQLEQAFATEVQQTYAVAVHSGTIGLFLALRACGIGSGDEVITVGNTDISTTGAITQCGAIPVLCDVLPSDYTINPQLVESLITPKTRAILPVDLHGHPANVKALRPLAEHHQLKIIEDAALATGAYDYGKPAGAFADLTMFSFAPLKPLGSAGNGAMLVTSDDEIHHSLRLLVGYGHDPAITDVMNGYQNFVQAGYNVPLDGLQAALLLVKLPHLKEWTRKRRTIAAALQTGLADAPLRLPRFRPESAPTFRSYALCVDRQQAVHQGLRDAGIEAVIHYAPPVYHYSLYAGQMRNCAALQVTDRLAEQLVNLPISPELPPADTAYMIEVLRSLL